MFGSDKHSKARRFVSHPCVDCVLFSKAGIASFDNPSQLLIALEPEAASIFVRRQRLHQLIPRDEELSHAGRRATTPEPIVVEHSLSTSRADVSKLTMLKLHSPLTTESSDLATKAPLSFHRS